jgi:hypothetical protein
VPLSTALNPTTATQVSGSWTTPNNATGANNSTFALWTSASSGATATLELSGMDFTTLITNSDFTIGTVSATIWSFETSITNITAASAQLFSGATAIGSAVSLTLSATSTNSQSINFPTAPTYAQINDLRVRITFTHAANVTSASGEIDAVSLQVNFTYTDTLPESLALTEAVATSQAWLRAPAETEGLTETALINQGRTGADTLAASESVSFVMNAARLPDESVRLSEQVVVNYNRADITDYQFVIAESSGSLVWVPFGRDLTIAISKGGFDAGSFDIRNQDVSAANADYRVFGTDYKTPPTWGWKMWTNTFTEADALAWLASLAKVWDDEVRETPNGVLPLRYSLAGRKRRVYGRPRRFTPTVDKVNLGKIYITADFTLAEDAYYEDDEQGITLGSTAASLTPSGIHIPAVVPWTFTTVPVPRTSQMFITGDKRTWVDIDFRGPVSNPYVQIGGLTYGLNGSIPLGRTITLSGKPWKSGVFDDLGSYYPGMLDPRARLSALSMKPATYPVTFGGIDGTGTAIATLRWRNCYRTL